MDPRIKEIVGTVNPPKGFEEFQDVGSALSRGLTVGIRLFLIVAGLTALYFLLWGSLDWIGSGGDKEKISKAQQRIGNAVLGLMMLFVIMGAVWVLENMVFGGRFCFGLTCAITLPKF